MMAVFETPWTGVVHWLYWGEFADKADRFVKAAGSSTRDADLAVVDSDSSILERLSAYDSPLTPPSKVSFAQRYDAVTRGLDLLESTARVALQEPALAGVKVGAGNGRTSLSVPWTAGETMSVEIRSEAPVR
ncbi:MAG: hypothetical protein ACYC8T_14400 [Myxococcaceae bacterium]